jgi:UDP-N-acetylmuramate: L-alanyl-gamma-D-glutamyl-meso-diaminopimelate ligase
MTSKVYLCGIGGIGMANFAALLKEAGWEVSGSDGAIYEPAATILRNAGITPLTPYDAGNVPFHGTAVIIGNAQSRGHVEVEAALNSGVELFSFPEFLHRHVMQGRHAMVVAGTHGKSSTTACLAHLLSHTGLDVGFLVGALPVDFPLGAHLGSKSAPFVLEGDEYDSAFFDKRSKFLHYFPRTLLLGPVEYDHADIFATLDEMLLSFRRLISLLPRNGRLVFASDCETTCRLAEAAPCPTISVGMNSRADWRLLPDTTLLAFRAPDGRERSVKLHAPGRHNRMNALMALAAANSYGSDLDRCVEALASFHGIRRRFECLLDTPGLTVFDDFAHHPTAIGATLQAVREAYPHHRLIAVFEPRSNTMVRNIFQKELAESLAGANLAIAGTIHRAERIPLSERLDLATVAATLNERGVPLVQSTNSNIPSLLKDALTADPTVVVFMSNGSFDGAPQEFLRLVAR